LQSALIKNDNVIGPVCLSVQISKVKVRVVGRGLGLKNVVLSSVLGLDVVTIKHLTK